MAAIEQLVSTSMGVLLSHGLNPETNKPITRTRTFSNIKTSATAEGLLSAAQTLASLQTHSVISVKRINTYELLNE